MGIRANGNVHLCTDDYEGKKVMGNVFEQGVREVWEDAFYAGLRRNIRKGRYDLEICQGCGAERIWLAGH